MDRRIKKISLFVVMAMMGCCRMSAQQVNAPLLAFKRTPFGFQKGSFWSAKGVLFLMFKVKCLMLNVLRSRHTLCSW